MRDKQKRMEYVNLSSAISKGIMDDSPNGSILLLFEYMNHPMVWDPDFVNLQFNFDFGPDHNMGYETGRSEEGFAGAGPLSVLEELIAKETGTSARSEAVTYGGRWSDLYQKTRDVFKTFWQSNRADYFICVEDDEAFLRRVDEVLEGLRIASARDGRTMHLVEPRWIQCDHTSRTIVIVDVHISDINCMLRLTQEPHHACVEDLMNDFQLDIEKVMFDPIRKWIMNSESVTESVINGKANITRSLLVTKGAPTKCESLQIGSLFKKMAKFGERGYKFSSYPKLLEVEAQIVK